jgi:hypothetical protein
MIAHEHWDHGNPESVMNRGLIAAAVTSLLLAACAAEGGHPAFRAEPADRGNNTAGVVSAPPTSPAGGGGVVTNGSQPNPSAH